MLGYLLNAPWFFGLVVVSGIIGAIGAHFFFLIYRFLARKAVHKFAPVNEEDLVERLYSRDFLLTGVLTGVAERFFFTLVIGLLGPSGVASAAIGWVAIKGQLHFKLFTDHQRKDIPRAYVGILGSLSSISFSALGGFAWENCFTLSEAIKKIMFIWSGS